MSRPTPATKAAAIADYRKSRESYADVAARHGISRATLHTWVNPTVRPKRGGFTWAEKDIVLTGGRWVNDRGIQRWVA